MKYVRTISLFVFLLLSLSSMGQIKVSFLIDDGFWVGVNRSIHLLQNKYPEVDRLCQFREYLYSNCQEENLDFLAGSNLVFVGIHNNGLIFKAKPQLQEAIDHGARIYALNLSHEYDSDLQEWGIHFDSYVLDAFKNGGENNLMNMMLTKLHQDFQVDCPCNEIEETPSSGIYNKENRMLYTDLTVYLKERTGIRENAPWFGVIVGKSDLTKSQYLYLDRVIQAIESEGFNVLPLFSSQQPGHHEEETIRRYLLESRLDVAGVLNLGCWYNLIPDQERKVLEALDVPVINGVMLNTTQAEWEASAVGIDVYNRSNAIAIPELAGHIFPTVTIVFEDLDNHVRIRNAVDYQLRTLLGRIRNLYNLRQKSNAEKKVALIYYSYPPGKENIGSSYLNVLPNSIVSMLQRMKEEGYRTGTAPIDSATIFDRIMDHGRNVGSWAPAEVNRLVQQGDPALVSMKQYRQWYDRLSPKLRTAIEEKWGKPEESRIMTWEHPQGERYFVLPLIRYGNIILTPQPARGWEENMKSLYHDPLMPPPHQYLAFYLFLKYGFQADALVHIGTHGTHEWLPGKEAGLGPDDYPEALIMDMPNIYPYIVDDVGEGLQAKRRGQAIIIDHLTPGFDRATLSPELRDLKSLISTYNEQKSKSALAAGVTFRELVRQMQALGLDKDLQLDSITPGILDRVDDYLREIEENRAPFGLHTFGRSPSPASLEATVEAIASRRTDLSPDSLDTFSEEVRENLRKSGTEELNAYIRALNGRYIRAGSGNDPIRNPSSLPTGKNFYAFDPRLIPSRSTCEWGEKLADELIQTYLQEHQGEYPNKVTINLWAVECIRNEGTMEAQALSLLGVRPIYNQADQVVDLEVIPASELRRPRVDVVFAPSGLYRDIFPEMMTMLDKAVTLAKSVNEEDNYVRRHIMEGKERLKEQVQLTDSVAERIASVRLFTSKSGAYGTGISGTVAASGTWNNELDVADVYFNKMSFLYGQGFWGSKAEEEYTYLPKDFSKDVLKSALKGTRVALHSRSSNLYGLLDNDDVFQYLGATGMAIRTLDGKSPTVMLTNLIDPSAPSQESVEKFLGREMKTRYLNPKWVDAMVNEGYAGARFINKMVFNLWGWEATLPEAVSDNDWNQIYETYIHDKYQLDIKNRFRKSGNLYAYQAMLARLIETVRKEYWHADKEIMDDMLQQFNETIKESGLGCSENVCNNEKLLRFVTEKINELPSVGTAEKSLYQEAISNLRKGAPTGDDNPENPYRAPSDQSGSLELKDSWNHHLPSTSNDKVQTKRKN
jgi:cobaltochelatase CobN